MFVLPLSRSAHAVAHRTALVPQLNRAVDRLFEQSLDRIFHGPAGDDSRRTPAMDVVETDSAYSVMLDVPGATREQLKVSVEGRRVSVETAEVVKPEGTEPAADGQTPVAQKVLYRERTNANYSRTVVLPAEVDQAASQAKFDNGVLTLTLAKKVPTGATRLTIS